MQNVDAIFDEMLSNNDGENDDDRNRRANGTCRPAAGMECPDPLDGCQLDVAYSTQNTDTTVIDEKCCNDEKTVDWDDLSSDNESVDLMQENVKLLNEFSLNNETMLSLCTDLQTIVKKLKDVEQAMAAAETKCTSGTAKGIYIYTPTILRTLVILLLTSVGLIMSSIRRETRENLVSRANGRISFVIFVRKKTIFNRSRFELWD